MQPLPVLRIGYLMPFLRLAVAVLHIILVVLLLVVQGLVGAMVVQADPALLVDVTFLTALAVAVLAVILVTVVTALLAVLDVLGKAALALEVLVAVAVCLMEYVVITQVMAVAVLA